MWGQWITEDEVLDIFPSEPVIKVGKNNLENPEIFSEIFKIFPEIQE